MSACALKRPISQKLCAIVLVLLFCFSVVPEIQAADLSPSPLRVIFLEGDGLSMGRPLTPELTDLESFHVEGGTAYISGEHYDDSRSLVPANGDTNLNQRAAELAASLTQELPLNAVLIDFDGALDDTLIGTTLTNRELMAYQANEGIAYTTDHLVQVSPHVLRLSQLFAHIDRNLENPEELTLYYSVDLGIMNVTDPSETEEPTEPSESEEPTEPSETEEETEPSETEEPTEPSESEEPTEPEKEAIDETQAEETGTETDESVTEESSEESTEEPAGEPTETSEPAEDTEDAETEESTEVTGEVTDAPVTDEAKDITEEPETEEYAESPEEPVDDPITVEWKTPDVVALEQVRSGLGNLLSPQIESATEEEAKPEAANAVDVVSEENDVVSEENDVVSENNNEDTPDAETTEGDKNNDRDVVVLLANLPSDPSGPAIDDNPPATVEEEPVTEQVTESTNKPVDPAMEKPEETQLPVKLEAPEDPPVTKIDQRFNVLSEATTILENYLPTLPDKNAFSARMQQRRIEELLTELRGQASTNEHRQILHHAENVLDQSRLKLEIKSTVVLIGATGESLLVPIILGSTLLSLGVGLFIARRRRRFT